MKTADGIVTGDKETRQARKRREFEQSAQYTAMVKRQEVQQKAYKDRQDKAIARAATAKKPMKWIGYTYRRPT
jgi:hypothetical protein